jgi:hypothetical protein
VLNKHSRLSTDTHSLMMSQQLLQDTPPRHTQAVTLSPGRRHEACAQDDSSSDVYLAAVAARSLGLYSATAACSVATWLGAKLIAQLSGIDSSRSANGLSGQLLAADRALRASCRPCLNALHQLAIAGSCCCGEQPPGASGAAEVDVVSPRC